MRRDATLSLTQEGDVAPTRRTIDAIYEEGVFKPLQDPGLPEHQRVVIDLRVESETDPQATLRRWRGVYAGLSDAEIAEVESIALDRSRFLPPED